jgi:ribosomal protein S18 acetylase RimI-like enzyme
MHQIGGLSFPASDGPRREPLSVGARALVLRPARRSDLRSFRLFHDQARQHEPLVANLRGPGRKAFLDQQFDLQHRHFVGAFPAASFLAVTLAEGARGAIGRLYVDRSGQDWRLIELSLDAAWQNLGIGSALIAWLQRQMRERGGRSIELGVLIDNPRARMLYRRMGFTDSTADAFPYRHMIWMNPAQVPAVASPL